MQLDSLLWKLIHTPHKLLQLMLLLLLLQLLLSLLHYNNNNNIKLSSSK